MSGLSQSQETCGPVLGGSHCSAFYGIIDPEYARIFTVARKLAWEEGYALAMHGSFTRDLDLLAVPWTDRACEPEHLVKRILASHLGLHEAAGNPGLKSHGRKVWTLMLPEFGDPRFVDLSIFMPNDERVHPYQRRRTTITGLVV
jgi:hypothetical protein